MWRLMQVLGVEARHIAGAPGRLALHCPQVMNTTAPYDLVRKMRASVLVLGPLPPRGRGTRVAARRLRDRHPSDRSAFGRPRTHGRQHRAGRRLCPRARAARPQGAKIRFPQPSVGATENLMMAATLAKGETVISEAACEPEIVDLAKCLNAMGAKIEGAGRRRSGSAACRACPGRCTASCRTASSPAPMPWPRRSPEDVSS